MKDDLISGAAAAAKFLGLPRRAIYRMTDDGHLPCVRKGRRLFFRKSELQRAFESQSSGKIERHVKIGGVDARVVIEPGRAARRFPSLIN